MNLDGLSGVYKRLLLFLFQLTAADVATLVRQVQKKKESFASLQQCVLKKKRVVILKEVFFVCND